MLVGIRPTYYRHPEELRLPDRGRRRSLDISTALERFGFRARTGFDPGLRRTIE